MEIVKLKDVAEIVSGSTPKTNKKEYWDGRIYWITPADLEKKSNGYIYSTSRKITDEGFESSNLKMLPVGTVLLTTRAPIGKVALAGVELCTNQGFKNIICNSAVLDSEYLYYYLTSQYDQLNALGRGATFKEISKKIVEDIVIPLPPLQTQQKIVQVLDKAQSLIDKRKEQIELMDELVQSTFYEMVGDPVVNPKEWKEYELRNLTEEKPMNGFFAKNHEYNDDGRTGVIWLSDFINKFYSDTTGLRKIDVNDKVYEKYAVKYGDVLFCRSSLNVEGIGKVSCVPSHNERLIFECHIIKVRLNVERILPEYFKVFSDSTYFRNQIMSKSKTATMTTIGQDAIISCKVLTPPIEEQKQFIEVLQSLMRYKQLMEQSLSEMENNYNSLMQRAFKGEIM